MTVRLYQHTFQIETYFERIALWVKSSVFLSHGEGRLVFQQLRPKYQDKLGYPQPDPADKETWAGIGEKSGSPVSDLLNTLRQTKETLQGVRMLCSDVYIS